MFACNYLNNHLKLETDIKIPSEEIVITIRFKVSHIQDDPVRQRPSLQSFMHWIMLSKKKIRFFNFIHVVSQIPTEENIN